MLADKDEQLIRPPLRRTASESGAVVGPSTPIESQHNSRIHDNDNPSVMDWNAGESPLLAWLNQVDSPVAAVETTWLNNHDQYPHISQSEEILNQEKKDIEVFKNIHIVTAPEPGTDDGSDLELPAQIYYRNIKDRYPLLPHFLTRRLAIANFNRANRLQMWRNIRGIGRHFTTIAEDSGTPEQLRTQNPWVKMDAMRPSNSISRSEILPVRTKLMLPPNLPPQVDILDKVPRAPLTLSQQNFWTAGRPSHRASSVHSDSSSKNSSLRGMDVMDSSYQRQNVAENHRERSFSAASSPNRGLFPAPIMWTSVDHGRKTSMFNCEICGALVRADRRRDWQ